MQYVKVKAYRSFKRREAAKVRRSWVRPESRLPSVGAVGGGITVAWPHVWLEQAFASGKRFAAVSSLLLSWCLLTLATVEQGVKGDKHHVTGSNSGKGGTGTDSSLPR